MVTASAHVCVRLPPRASRFVQQPEAVVSMPPRTPATPGTIRPWLPDQSGRRSPWRAPCSPERAACLHPQRTVSLSVSQQQLWAGLLGAHLSPALQPLRGSCPGLGGRGPLCPQERALALVDTGTYTARDTGSRRGRLPLGTRGPSVFGCASLKGAGLERLHPVFLWDVPGRLTSPLAN